MGRDYAGKLELVVMDNIDYYMEHEVYQENQYKRWLETRPICEKCGEPIEDEFGYQINGEWYHEDCIDVFYKKVTA